jgi:replication-associated recombination protein RarA
MSVQRICEHFESTELPRLNILYGPGIDDLFYNRNLNELKFEEALYEELRRQGYDRVVFFSPHRSIFFFDEQSQNLTRPEGSSRSSFETTQTQLNMDTGPLSDLKLIKSNTAEVSFSQKKGMEDVFALRLLDAIIRDRSSIRSAVVILQTEVFLRYFEDQRTLSSLIGDWTKIESINRNSAFFIFSVDNYQDLCDLSRNFSIPELRNLITRNTQKSKHSRNLMCITTPDVREIRYMIQNFRTNHTLGIAETEFELICHRMAAEGQQSRHWLNRLNNISTLSLEITRREGWFQANSNFQNSVWERIDSLVGLENVKNRIREFSGWLKVIQKRRQSQKENVEMPSLHMVFTGNPGTGKTTMARLFGELLYESGFLKRGHLVEARTSDLVAEHVGGTAIKTNTLVDKALDGVLFIDEAYALAEDNRGGFGQEAVETLLSRIEDDRHRFVVILAGYSDKMNRFLNSNPGLTRRFPKENIFHFEDFDHLQLIEILLKLLQEMDLVVEADFQTQLFNLVYELWRRRDENFGNAGEMRNLAEALDRRRAARIQESNLSDNELLRVDDLPVSYRHLLPHNTVSSDEILSNLETLVGLDKIKDFLRNLVTRLEYENIRYQTLNRTTGRPGLQHMVFKGNPGTGKTTIARMIGGIYHQLGLLNRGHCVEVTRVDLVAGFSGQTSQKTLEKIKQAVDGVLFIDEAYTLVSDPISGFGQEAVDTLVKAMEDFQGRLVVIVAGYTEPMNSFLLTNPGLLSRFAIQLDFVDFSLDQLIDILIRNLEKEGYTIENPACQKAREYLQHTISRQGKFFGNARSILSMMEEIKNNLAKRVLPLIKVSSSQQNDVLLNTITANDIPEPEAYLWKKSNQESMILPKKSD